jgi:hypothetical protein
MSTAFVALVFYRLAHGAQRLKNWLGEIGDFFGTKKVIALPSPRALTCWMLS